MAIVPDIFLGVGALAHYMTAYHSSSTGWIEKNRQDSKGTGREKIVALSVDN